MVCGSVCSVSWLTFMVYSSSFLYFFSDLHTCSLVCRTAGLPQYGQLGHGTDNEVCGEDNLSLTSLVHISAAEYHSQSFAG